MTDLHIPASPLLRGDSISGNLDDSVFNRLLRERITADFDRDRWFSAQEAKDYGFIDKVITGAQQAPEGAGTLA